MTRKGNIFFFFGGWGVCCGGVDRLVVWKLFVNRLNAQLTISTCIWWFCQSDGPDELNHSISTSSHDISITLQCGFGSLGVLLQWTEFMLELLFNEVKKSMVASL